MVNQCQKGTKESQNYGESKSKEKFFILHKSKLKPYNSIPKLKQWELISNIKFLILQKHKFDTDQRTLTKISQKRKKKPHVTVAPPSSLFS
jgi:hypothetical protein